MDRGRNIKKTLVFAVVILTTQITSSAAISFSIEPYLDAGGGSCIGSLLDGKRQLYEELGSSSPMSPGSSNALLAILGGGGANFRLRDSSFRFASLPFSLSLGLGAGFWGGVLSGTTSSGQPFASATARALALCLHADMRWQFEGDKGGPFAEFGLFGGTALFYFLDERMSGVESAAIVPANRDDLGYWGIGAGAGYLVPIGSILVSIGGRVDVGLSRLSGATGALSGSLERSWRTLLRAAVEFPLGRRP